MEIYLSTETILCKITYMSYIVHQVNILIIILLVERVSLTKMTDKSLSKALAQQNIPLAITNH